MYLTCPNGNKYYVSWEYSEIGDTTCILWDRDKNTNQKYELISTSAYLHPDDNFNKIKGRKLSFKRLIEYITDATTLCGDLNDLAYPYSDKKYISRKRIVREALWAQFKAQVKYRT